MTGKDNEDEREPRYAHLLQPNRDLAANWAVDVARELENYLADLSLASLPCEGHDSLNFAEAALLIQGSIQIYSRKVEYLYVLVLQALDFIAQKKHAQQESTSIQATGKDTDIVEEQEEDFLNLDDVPEEANIDIIDEENGPCSITPAVKPPACLIVTEGDNLDLSGDAGELASYQISTSSLHRDFLLLDPCDAEFVDEYWKAKEGKQRQETPTQPPSSARRRSSRSGVGTPSRKPATGQDADAGGASRANSSELRSPRLGEAYPPDDDLDDWHDDIGGGETWGGGCVIDESSDRGMKDTAGPALDKEADNGGPGAHDQEDDDVDPWAPLNPHEPGTLPVMPYKRGRPNRKMRMKKTGDPLSEAVANGSFSELTKVWQALECLERETQHSKQSDESPLYEKLRSSFIVNGASLFDAELSQEESDEGPGSGESDSDDGRWDAADEPADTYEPDFVGTHDSQDPSQQSRQDPGHNDLDVPEKGADEGLSLEDLCRSHLDSILKNHGESEVRTALVTRVTSWKHKIEKNLAEQEAHTPFDIHVYGERVLEKLSLSDDEANSNHGEKSFTEIVAGLETYEVARTFASLLQLVNNGNVSLEKGRATNTPFCFTAESPFSVKLLTSRKRHEEMLLYRAPSTSIKNSNRKTSKKEIGVLSQPSSLDSDDENAMGSFTFGGQAVTDIASPCSLLPSRRNSPRKRMSARFGQFEANSELVETNKNLGSTRSTPEGKRRRRRRSHKSVQLELAG